MRLAHIAPYFAPVVGGLENVVYELCTGMAARGHAVTVFTSDLTRTGRTDRGTSRVGGITVHRSRAIARLGAHASIWPGFLRTMRREAFDVVHAHPYRHPQCDLASLDSIRKDAKFVLDPHWPDYPRSASQLLVARAYDATFGRRLIRSADAILVATPLEVPWLVAQGAKRVQVLAHGVPDEWFLRPSDGASFRHEHAVQGLFVLAVGRIDESKGFQYVVEALRHVPECTFVIAGPAGPYHPRLVQVIRANGLEGRVRILGHLSEGDKLRALDSCDVFVQPSLFEAFGISTLEAMARGKACIGSRVGGLSWLLDGCGIAVEPRSAEGIGDALRLLAREESVRRELGAAARRKAETMTWSKVVDAYEQFLTQLLVSCLAEWIRGARCRCSALPLIRLRWTVPWHCFRTSSGRGVRRSHSA